MALKSHSDPERHAGYDGLAVVDTVAQDDLIPCMNRSAMRNVTNAPATGPGMAMRSAVSFGKKASSMRMIPMTTPTRRAPIPVNSARDMLDE